MLVYSLKEGMLVYSLKEGILNIQYIWEPYLL